MHKPGYRRSPERVIVAVRDLSEKFSTFTEFLENTASEDRQFLSSDEFHKIPASVCAFANSCGGWLILGAEFLDDEINFSGIPEDFNPGKFCDEFQIFTDPAKIIVSYIPQLTWHRKPQTFGGKIYRRVEGENLISGKQSGAIIITDAQEFSRDDFPVENANFDDEAMNEFREVVIKSHDEYKIFSRDEFLRRSFIFSGKHLTFAGALMFGDIMQIRAGLHYNSDIIAIEANNIWKAYRNILPRITLKLSDKCAAAVHEALINSLLHSDYNISREINITITPNPAKILIDNPGTIRGVVRNQRLMKIFDLAGISRYKVSNAMGIHDDTGNEKTFNSYMLSVSHENISCNHDRSSGHESSNVYCEQPDSLDRKHASHEFYAAKTFMPPIFPIHAKTGMYIIKTFSPTFKLEQDMLNFRVNATLRLEGYSELPEIILL